MDMYGERYRLFNCWPMYLDRAMGLDILEIMDRGLLDKRNIMLIQYAGAQGITVTLKTALLEYTLLQDKAIGSPYGPVPTPLTIKGLR